VTLELGHNGWNEAIVHVNKNVMLAWLLVLGIGHYEQMLGKA
jgi:hypothetical protein